MSLKAIGQIIQSNTVERFGFDLRPALNSGLGGTQFDSLWMEEFLLPGILGHFWRIEHTLCALSSFGCGAELFPEDYGSAIPSLARRGFLWESHG
ncbi:MAG: hypothetical protein JWO80_3406 [Bryobacterales bacterium]|nr:hypothetical protein [Bryobacterales bacterium]